MARILVIEDNPDNLELMTYLLKAFGHAILTAGDGDEGVAVAFSERPDLIVCDVHLPKADGYAVAKRLKADPELAQVPLVAVTALAMVGDRDRVLAGGFDGYLTKPIDPQAFVGQLERYLHDAPASAPPASWQNAPTPEAPKPDGARVVVVDDVEVNRELLRQTLEPMGYQVWLASDVAAGLRLVREVEPDLILSDQQMPSTDGFDFIRQLKADVMLATIPCLLLSSSEWGERDRETARRLGAARFIERPIEPRQLLDEIDACLRQYRGGNHGDPAYRR